MSSLYTAYSLVSHLNNIMSLFFTASQTETFISKASYEQNLVFIDSYLWACTANLANFTVMELGLFGRPFRLLQLVLVKRGLLIGVSGRGCHHVAARVAPR